MEMSQPENRMCDGCQNTMTLNLFPKNSTKCRYCVNGIEVPRRLITYINKSSFESTSTNKKESTTDGPQEPTSTNKEPESFLNNLDKTISTEAQDYAELYNPNNHNL